MQNVLARTAGILCATLIFGASAAKAEPMQLRLATFGPPTSYFYVDVVLPWAEAVSKDSEGTIEINASHGQVRVGTVTGDAVIKSSHGSIEIGESGGDVDAKLSFGDLDIETARASVAAKTAHGSIHVREVSAGSIDVESGLGGISIGVRPQVPAWLDLASKHGHVRNQLAADGAPDTGEQTVAVRARTQVGDITIQRSR